MFNKHIKFFLITFCFWIILFSGVNARHIEEHQRISKAYLTSTGVFFNLKKIYPNGIRYYSSLSSKVMKLNIEGKTYSVKFADTLSQVFKDISTLLNIPGLTFTLTNSIRDANLLIMPDDEGALSGDTVMSSVMKNYQPETEKYAVLVVSKRQLESTVGRLYKSLYEKGFISHYMTIPEFLKLFVYQTVYHETGHILALAHPNENVTSYGFLVKTISTKKVETIFDEPIMISSMTHYFCQLAQYLRRPLVSTDIDYLKFSQAEIEGIKKLFSVHFNNNNNNLSNSLTPYLEYMYMPQQLQYLGKIDYLSDDDPRLLPTIVHHRVISNFPRFSRTHLSHN